LDFQVPSKKMPIIEYSPTLSELFQAREQPIARARLCLSRSTGIGFGNSTEGITRAPLAHQDTALARFHGTGPDRNGNGIDQSNTERSEAIAIRGRRGQSDYISAGRARSSE